MEKDNIIKDVDYQIHINRINHLVTGIKKSYIALGYRLKQARDEEIFTGRYADVWEFAKTEFNISKSTASRLMAINDRFSIDGNSMKPLPEYSEFSVSQLMEMLTLKDEQLKEVTVGMTVAQIRDMKEKTPVDEDIEGQMQIEDFKEVLPQNYENSLNAGEESTSDTEECDRTAVFEDAQEAAGVEEMPENGINAKAESYSDVETQEVNPDDRRNGIERIVAEVIAPVKTPETATKELTDMEVAEEELEKLREKIKFMTEYNAPTVAVNKFRVTSEAMEFYIRHKKAHTYGILNVDKWNNGNCVCGEHINVPAGEKRYCSYCGSLIENKLDETEIRIMPELPVLKNNEQRAEWLKNYREWGVWTTIPEIGATLYRFDVAPDKYILVAEYKLKYYAGSKINTSSPHYHIIDRTHYFSEYSSSMTELIEFIKANFPRR